MTRTRTSTTSRRGAGARTGVMALLVCLVALGGATSCLAGGTQSEEEPRVLAILDVAFDQKIVVQSSILSFRFLETSRRQASHATVRFFGSLGQGRELDEEFVLPLDRLGDDGDLVVRLPVRDGLWEAVDPQPERTLTGTLEFELNDEIGVFARGEVDSVLLRFKKELPPVVAPLPNGSEVYPNQHLEVSGSGFLRPEEGQTWAVVDSGELTLESGATRRVTNVRVALVYGGSRQRALFPVSPAIFGVQVARFRGNLRFENVLTTGNVFEGSEQPEFSASLRAPRIDELTPERASRGQKISILGRGFLATDEALDTGTYLVLEGEHTPDDPAASPLVFDASEPLVQVPYRIVDEQTIEQFVWYSVDHETREVSGIGAYPGVFRGTITPVIYQGNREQVGQPWEGSFRVAPPRQVVFVKYLPGFTRALELYGLQNVEQDIRERIMYVLRRDYEGINAEFRDEKPTDFIEYTTIEIGGPDPSGMLNFGYDNSYNEGGKDIGNLYLGDYLGGVNRHSQKAGYLPYGGVFIESFIAFSPTLFPDTFGTSREFDRMLAPFMPGLGGTPVRGDEWPQGPRIAAIKNAIELLGNLTGHTASHEIGHALGLAHFPTSIEGYEERFHNEPPGPNLIMDAGSDRPFEERAELNGQGPAVFSDENRRYLRMILPLE